MRLLIMKVLWFSPAQRSLLVKYGVSDLYVAYDNDTETKAGDKGWELVNKVVGDLFRLHRIELPPSLDPGDMEGDEIRETFLPFSQSC